MKSAQEKLNNEKKYEDVNLIFPRYNDEADPIYKELIAIYNKYGDAYIEDDSDNKVTDDERKDSEKLIKILKSADDLNEKYNDYEIIIDANKTLVSGIEGMKDRLINQGGIFSRHAVKYQINSYREKINALYDGSNQGKE